MHLPSKIINYFMLQYYKNMTSKERKKRELKKLGESAGKGIGYQEGYVNIKLFLILVLGADKAVHSIPAQKTL